MRKEERRKKGRKKFLVVYDIDRRAVPFPVDASLSKDTASPARAETRVGGGKREGEGKKVTSKVRTLGEKSGDSSLITGGSVTTSWLSSASVRVLDARGQ